jgi:hypothetical protein
LARSDKKGEIGGGTKKISVKGDSTENIKGINKFTGNCSKVEEPVSSNSQQEIKSYEIGCKDVYKDECLTKKSNEEYSLNPVNYTGDVYISTADLDISVYDEKVGDKGVNARLFIGGHRSGANACPQGKDTNECCSEYFHNSSYLYVSPVLGQFFVMSIVKYGGIENAQGINNTMPFSRKDDPEVFSMSVCNGYLCVNDVRIDTYLVIPKEMTTVELAYTDNNPKLVISKKINEEIKLVENGKCVIRKVRDILDSRLSLDTSSLGSGYVYYVYGKHNGSIGVSDSVPFSPKCFYFIKVSSFSFGNSTISSDFRPKSLYILKKKRSGSGKDEYVIDDLVNFSNLFVRNSGSSVNVLYSEEIPNGKDIGSMLVNSLVNFSTDNISLKGILSNDNSNSNDSSNSQKSIDLNVKSLISIDPSSTFGEPIVYGKQFSTKSINVLLLSFSNDGKRYRSFSELFLAENFGFFYCNRWNMLATYPVIFGVMGFKDKSGKFFTGLARQLSSIDISSGKENASKEKVWRDTSKYYSVIDFMKKNKDLETFPGDIYNILVPLDGSNPAAKYAIPSDIIFSYKESPFLRFYINIPSDVTKMISGTLGNGGKKS